MTDPAADLRKKGYTIIPSFLSATDLTLLREAATSLTTLARSGHWPHVRTQGKQFPPWPAPSPSSSPIPIWGVQHLLHPSLPLSPSHRAAFIRLYFSPDLLSLSANLLSYPGHAPATKSDLSMELFNMLVRPDSDKKWNLVWHRDDIPPSATPSEEEGVLKREAWHAQWNLALYRDEALEVVPGSHLRARTDVERRITTLQNGDEEEMPGAVKVILEPGDVVFYDSNILHRGVYDPAVERMTLHGSVGHVRGSEARARNVLQHGVGVYVADCDFGCLGGETEERAVAEGMRERLVAMGRERGGEGDVGYSLEG